MIYSFIQSVHNVDQDFPRDRDKNKKQSPKT